MESNSSVEIDLQEEIDANHITINPYTPTVPLNEQAREISGREIIGSMKTVSGRLFLVLFILVMCGAGEILLGALGTGDYKKDTHNITLSVAKLSQLLLNNLKLGK